MSDINKTVVVAMSGGVDSSLTAVLLKERGYNVIGLTMRLWDDSGLSEEDSSNKPCCSVSMTTGAKAVCRQLGVPHYVIDFREKFQKAVIDDFYNQYMEGLTPNPCVRCNTFIKWEPLVDRRKILGAEFMATGHYAKVHHNKELDRWELHKGVDHNKDQSYFLWGLTGEHLKNTMFPLGEMTKPEVREMANNMEIATANKPESMDICFIPDNNYRDFVAERTSDDEMETRVGNLVDTDGKFLGTHPGYQNFTIGQRKGLGIALGVPAYVTEIDVKTNTVVIGGDDDLKSDVLFAESMNWINGVPNSPENPGSDDLDATVKIRYRNEGTEAKLMPIGKDKVKVEFKEPVRAITPGQSTVFYKGDRVIGGGIISRQE